MNINEDFKLTGKLQISLNGKVVQETPNLILTAGKSWIPTVVAGTGTKMSHIAVGTGSTAPVIGDTALETEIARTALDVAGGSASGVKAIYAVTIPPGTATGAITEAGIVNAATGGTMLARTTFSVVNKGASDSMVISWAITFG